MIRNVFTDFLFSILLVVIMCGCAGLSTTEKQVDSVVSLQVDVLKKIVEMRKHESIKSRINADPVLMEQENILMSGLDSVISSQETYLNEKSKIKSERGANVH